MQLAIALALGVLMIVIAAALIWNNSRKREAVFDLKIISSAGRLYQRKLKLFLDTARDEDRNVSWFINRLAVRRHYKTGKLAQLCVDYSALPLFLGIDAEAAERERTFCKGRKAVIAKNALHQRIGNNQREVAQETTRQTYRLVAIGTVIIVLVICSVVLITSGKINMF